MVRDRSSAVAWRLKVSRTGITLVHCQVQRRPVLLEELQISTGRLARTPAEEDELGRVSASVDKMRKQKLSSGRWAALAIRRSRGDQEVAALKRLYPQLRNVLQPAR